MSQSNSTNSYGNNCPAGGQFYACTKSLFVGCCASDPCTNDCPAGNIRPTAFTASQHGNTTDASCASGSQFFTCVYTGKTPDTFWGCCKSDPCAQGSCPTGDLTGAFLGSPAQIQAYIGVQSPSSSPSSSPSATGTNPPAAEGSKTNVAAIAGGAAGGVVVVLILLGLLIFYMRRAKKAKKAQAELETQQNGPSFLGGAVDKKHSSGVYEHPDAPPQYTSPHSSPQPKFPATFSPHSPQTQWAHQSPIEISELPSSPMTPGGSSKPPNGHRLSELPADATQAHTKAVHHHRISELSSEPARAERAQPSELESLVPQSPRRTPVSPQNLSPVPSPGFAPVVSPLLEAAPFQQEAPSKSNL